MPVLTTLRSLDRSATFLGAMSRFISSVIHLGLRPSVVTPCCSAIFSKTVGSGMNGEPSYNTALAPKANCDTLDRYMIHPVVVYCSPTSSGVTQRCRMPSLRVLMRRGPTAWTIAFGIPVVPEE